ncbi:hypothetical protein [Actinoplanes sp. TFC3]|uniref:hypothetical protein n=1 Tax=Actinoplanes sp. TFC3 TaxID=1710355 RepID=UPI00082E8202|nr:hypothetical protein [Actinoplanes sp. TFC3]
MAKSKADEVSIALHEAVDTRDQGQRQAALCTAYEAAGRWQNRLGLSAPVEATRRSHFDRPYPVSDAERFAAALRARISDATLSELPAVGGIDQYVDSTDVLVRPDLTRRMASATIDTDRQVARTGPGLSGTRP